MLLLEFDDLDNLEWTRALRPHGSRLSFDLQDFHMYLISVRFYRPLDSTPPTSVILPQMQTPLAPSRRIF
jgi:hypothetical protein